MRRPLRLLAVLICAVACSPSVAHAHARGGAGSLLTGFLAAPTDQLSVPGMLAGGEITPEGDLYTGWAEYELRYGTGLRAWRQPTRTLGDPGVPLLSSTLHDGQVLYRLTVFAVAVGGRPVAYETVTARNRSREPRWAKVAMQIAYTRGRQVRGAHGLGTGAFRYERPVGSATVGYYDQPGEAFSPTFAYSIRGRDLDRSGLLLARGPDRASRPLASPHASTPTAPTAPHDGRLLEALLPPGRGTSWTWQIPLQPPHASTAEDRLLDRLSLSDAHKRLSRMWSAEERGMTSISVPEARVSAAYRAAVVEILGSRYRSAAGWVQATNKLQYESFWLRDAALQTQALDLAGLHDQAAENLAFVDGFQRSDGLFISRAQQYDGLGQALWALASHAELTQSHGYAAAQLQRMGAAIAWLSQATALDPLGLLPAAQPGDDELAFGHIAGDDFWAAAGLRAAIADAALAGRADLARAWEPVDHRFEGALEQAATAALASAGHIPPVLDEVGGQDWGNYYAAYPVEVLPASSSAVSSTLGWAREHMVGGLETYANGASLHDYLGFAIFETELEAGDTRDAIAGLYAELAHTTATYGGWEWNISPFGFRGAPANPSPHGTFAADYIALLRNLLVQDTSSGDVRLLAGASPAWLAVGEHISVTSAPTKVGRVSFTERSTARGETLQWHSSPSSNARLIWVLPAWARHRRVGGRRVGSTIVLPSRSGSLSVTFGGHRPAQSYASAVAALNAVYRAHGKRPPLVPAAR